MARVYQSSSMGEAQLRVAIVSARGAADLLVHRVGSWGMAHGDALWFITHERQDASVCICFTSEGMADFKVCFVDNFGEAGWQKPSRFRGRLGV